MNDNGGKTRHPAGEQALRTIRLAIADYLSSGRESDLELCEFAMISYLVGSRSPAVLPFLDNVIENLSEYEMIDVGA